jgi:hypothetical protein
VRCAFFPSRLHRGRCCGQDPGFDSRRCCSFCCLGFGDSVVRVSTTASLAAATPERFEHATRLKTIRVLQCDGAVASTDLVGFGALLLTDGFNLQTYRISSRNISMLRFTGRAWLLSYYYFIQCFFSDGDDGLVDLMATHLPPTISNQAAISAQL